MLELVGRTSDTSNEYARAFGGALVVVGILRELTQLRRIVYAALKSNNG